MNVDKLDKTQITPYKILAFRQVEKRDNENIRTATNQVIFFFFLQDLISLHEQPCLFD